MFNILPDTGANVSAVPNESYLMSVESRQRLGVDNVGPQSGVSVATGTMRVEFTDVHGNKYQRDLPGVHVIPSMKRVVMGNNCELAGIQWDSMQRRIVLSPTSAERANNNAPADVRVTRRNWLYQLPVRILRRADPVLPRSAPMTDAEIWEYATDEELRCLDEKRAASSWRSTTNTPPPVPDDAERLRLWRQAAELQHRKTLDDDDELTFSDTTLPMCEPTPILFAEYFGGIGGATHHTNGIFESALYCDSDSVAADAYYSQFPGVPQYGNFVDAIRNKAFIQAAKHIPVAFASPPCNDFTVLNPTADPTSANADLTRKTVASLALTQHEVLVVESVPGIATANGGAVIAAIFATAKRVGYVGYTF